MDNTNGFIVLPRRIEEWGWADDPATMYLFVKLVFRANWKDGEWRGETIERGSLVTSVARLSCDVGLSVKQVRRALANIKKSGLITVDTPNGYTKIGIVDYDCYQSTKKPAPRLATVTQPATPGASGGQAMGDNRMNEDKEKGIKEAIERLYAMYPASVLRRDGNRAALRSKKDKEKLERLLRHNTEEQLAETIRQYLDGNPGPYTKMFSTFLNNLPDYGDEGRLFTDPEPVKRQQRKPQE